MSTKRRILALTGIRSDYDLMAGVYRNLLGAPDVELGLLVSGAHLSPTYGLSVRNIEEDGFPIAARVESLIDGNTRSSRLKSMSILLQNALDPVVRWSPDAILYPGDREDVMVGALLGGYLGIPTVHFFGGDHASDGNVDNPVRHAASKLSSLHFVAHEQHRKRLLAIGEPSERIHVVGNPALDRFRLEPKVARADLLAPYGWQAEDAFAIVIFHPILGYETSAGDQFRQVVDAVVRAGVKAFVSAPNADAGNKDILGAIRAYEGHPQVRYFGNLDRLAFVNLMREAAFLIGNSSAGILESSSIPVPAINVGERQRGRLAAENVLFVDAEAGQIDEAIRTARSEAFLARTRQVVSPYGDGHSAERCARLLRTLDLEAFLKKGEDPLSLPGANA
jgi:UDP-hydrolysing UDP-N-acetyl-D-glucosamine 2-epimerase